MNRAVLAMVALMAAIAAGEAAAPQTPPPFDVQEASIAQIHAAMKAGRLTCRALVEQYLRRIDAFDKQGPAINAIVLVNPEAGKLADDLDRRFAASGFVGLLHCVPMHLFDRLGLTVIGVPIVNYDNSQHSHNENLRVGHFWRGIETYAALLAALRW